MVSAVNGKCTDTKGLLTCHLSEAAFPPGAEQHGGVGAKLCVTPGNTLISLASPEVPRLRDQSHRSKTHPNSELLPLFPPEGGLVLGLTVAHTQGARVS